MNPRQNHSLSSSRPKPPGPWVLVALSACLGVAFVGAERRPGIEAPRLATVDVLACVEAVLAAPANVGPREDEHARWARRLDAIGREIESAGAEREGLAPGPERDRLTARLAQLQRDLVTTRDEAARASETALARQAGEAFERVRRHATEAAAARGYSHLIAARTGTEGPAPASTVRALTQQILARPVLMAPPEDDLTQAVLDRLRAEGLTPDARSAP